MDAMTANARTSSPKVEPLSGTLAGGFSLPGFGGGVPVITEGGVPEGGGVGVPEGGGVGVPEGGGVGVPEGGGVGVPEGGGVGVPEGGGVPDGMTMSAIPEKLNRKLLGWRFPLPWL